MIKQIYLLFLCILTIQPTYSMEKRKKQKYNAKTRSSQSNQQLKRNEKNYLAKVFGINTTTGNNQNIIENVVKNYKDLKTRNHLLTIQNKNFKEKVKKQDANITELRLEISNLKNNIKNENLIELND